MTPSAQHRDPPELALVVVAGSRPLRLRWLLNALEDQAGAPGRLEVIVVCPAGRRDPLATDHPLVAEGAARVLEVPASSSTVARNLGWRAARAPLVGFADEDTRPPRDWVKRALDDAARTPDAVIAGGLVPDPFEDSGFLALVHESRRTRPGDPLAPLAGSVWPRWLLEALDGLEEAAPDETAAAADLVARAREHGARIVPAAGLVLYDSVRSLGPGTPAGAFTAGGGLAWAVRRHPSLRAELALGVFRRPSHAALAAAVFAASLAPRRVAVAAVAFPLVVATASGLPPRRVLGRGLREGAEMAALAAGSARHRTLVL